MQSKSKLGVAVAGLGVGEHHARMLSRLPDVGLVKIFDPAQEKSNSLAGELGVEVAASFDELVEDSRISAIVIASPDHCHAEQILKSLQAGKNIFVEKPICNTDQELKDIVDTWRKKSGELQMFSNLILRTAPLYQWLKKQIDEGVLGEIFAFDGDYLYGRKERIINGWRGVNKDYSGIKGGGIHIIDMMCWLTGQKPASVNTMANDLSTRGTGINMNDFMACMFRFDSGLIGRVTSNLGCVHRHHHAFRIFGTKATFLYDDQGPRLHLNSDPALTSVPVQLESLPAGKAEIIPIFINAIATGIDSREQTEDAFRIINILTGCDESLKTGLEVEIKYI